MASVTTGCGMSAALKIQAHAVRTAIERMPRADRERYLRTAKIDGRGVLVTTTNTMPRIRAADRHRAAVSWPNRLGYGRV